MNQELLFHIYDAILEKIDTGVHGVDVNGKTVIYNRKMREIEGMELEDLLDKNIMDVFQFYGEESTLLKVLRTKEPEIHKRQKYINIRGEEINTINDSYPVFFNGEIIGAIEIAKDVTRIEKAFQSHLQRDKAAGCLFSRLAGNNPEFRRAVQQARRLAKDARPAFLIGEAGTGKRTFAKCMHHDSDVSGKSFFLLSCQTYESGQLDEMLFGPDGEEGILEDPAIGTVYIDELAALSLPLQEKLLDDIRRRSETGVSGGPRVIFGTCCDPVDAAAEGKLLKPLYYELSGAAVFIPRLKSRLEDLPVLTQRFLEKCNALFGTSVKSVSKDVYRIFRQYDWPGNAGELEFVIESAVKNAGDSQTLTVGHLPSFFRKKTIEKAEELLVQRGKELKSLDDYMAEAEMYYLKKALKLHDDNITKTAESLKMSRQNLQYRLRKYGLLNHKKER
jgi:arginine utilization regulatory protein